MSNQKLNKSSTFSMFLTKVLRYIRFYILLLLGHLNETLLPSKTKDRSRNGYVPLVDKGAKFYQQYIFKRMGDVFDYPICSVPGSEIVLRNRIFRDKFRKFEYTGYKTKCVNLTSYDYLGFSNNSGPSIEEAISSIYEYGVTTGGTRHQYGTCELHLQLEKLLAEFLGVEDAVTFGMGYATNSLNIPSLLSPGCLVISDKKNHSSIILGIRLSGATVKVFKHNDVQHLEKILRENIYTGQPNQPDGAYKPWKKILIAVEGIYSMEGIIACLPEIVALKKKYKAYLYLDEAHSLGALGKQGRGVTDYFGCDPKDVDVLMGTFTKMFASAGGYIAGNKELITLLRKNSVAAKHAWAMAPPVAAQIVPLLKIMLKKGGKHGGQKRIESLARNVEYFRTKIERTGVVVQGNKNSPLLTIIVDSYSKMIAMVRILHQRKIAMIGVAYPIIPLMEAKIRICLSAAHTKYQLDYAVREINKVAIELGLK